MYLDIACVKRILDVFDIGDDYTDSIVMPEFNAEKVSFCMTHLISEEYIECDVSRPTVIVGFTKKGIRLREILLNDKVYCLTCDTLSGFRNITADILSATAEKIAANIAVQNRQRKA